MIAILYPLKMDNNLSEAYSSIYEALHPTVARNDAINKERAMKAAQERKVPQNVRDASRRQVTAGGPKDVGANKYTTADKKTIINYNKDKMNNSYEPEGEMIDEMKAPRMQKGAMAYDGPNKERSEAADRVLAKTKKKKKKMNEGAQDDAVDQIMGGGKRDAQKDAVKQYVKYSSKNKKMRKEGKYRTEWEDIKLNEMLKYRSQFDNWLLNILEEGYDIERWTDDELLDTFIDENNLWESRESVDKALLSREDEFISEEDKKGKGSGKKDACYKKVKASAKVWPSAYASGRLVQCRKKGAANYGNSKEDFSDWRSDLQVITEKDAPYGEGAKEAKKKGASSETRGKRIYNRAREIARDRYKEKGGSGYIYKSERAGYNLSRNFQGGNRNRKLSTQGGPQTGGNESSPTSMGGYYTPRAQSKSYKGTKDNPGKGNPIKKKSESGDTGSHQKKADTMRTTTKSGKKLKKPTYKYKPEQRASIGAEGRAKRKDPKKNPLHQKNTGVVKNPKKQERKEKVKKQMVKSDFDLVAAYNSMYHSEAITALAGAGMGANTIHQTTKASGNKTGKRSPVGK